MPTLTVNRFKESSGKIKRDHLKKEGLWKAIHEPTPICREAVQ